MEASKNYTFDEVQVGESLTLTRKLTQMEVEALSLVSGDVDPFHIDGKKAAVRNGKQAKSVGGEALLTAMLCRRLPGPGTTILEQNLRFWGSFSAAAPSRRARSALRTIPSCSTAPCAAGVKSSLPARSRSRRRHCG